MSDTTSFILVYPDSEYPSSRVLTAGQGFALSVSGSAVTINAGDRLGSLATLDTTGVVAYNATSKVYSARSFVNGSGITISNQTGGGNITIAQDPETVIQKIKITDVDATVFPTSSVVQFLAGTDDIDITTTTDGGTGYAVVTIGTTNPSGTVTSVNCTSSDSFITVSGVPITGSGTIALTIGTLSIAKGGTAGTTRETAFNNISPITTAGDIIYGTGTDAADRLPIGTANQVLQVDSVTLLPVWSSGPGTGSVTSVDIASTTGLLSTGGPVTGSGTIAVNLPGSGVDSAIQEGDLLVGGTGGSYLVVASSSGSAGDFLSNDGAGSVAWAAVPSANASFLVQDGTNVPSPNGINLDNPEIALGVGVVPASNPMHASLGDGSVTILNNFAAPATNAGNLLLGVGDTTSASDATCTSNIVSFTGTATDLAAHRFYASRGSSASPSALQAAGNVAFEFWGQYDSTPGHYAKAASIIFAAEAAFSATDEHQSSIAFRVSPTGEADPLDALVLSPDLSVTIPGGLSAGSLALGTPLPTTHGGTGGNYANNAALFNALSPTHAMGDLIYNSGGANSALAISLSNQFLRSNGVVPGWSSLYSSGNGTFGTATAITTTRTVSSSAVYAASAITLTITNAVGAPTIAPAVYATNIVPGSSFDIVPIAVGGGGGKASSIDVMWMVA